MKAESYFDANSFRFLGKLARNNSRDWFHEHKLEYQAAVRDPFLRLLADLQTPLAKISPHYRADPRPVGGSLFRIQRDTRFSNNKLPYKTWAGARLFHARSRETEAPSFYIHIQPGRCFVGGGLWHPEPKTLHRLREFLADNPQAWIKATQNRSFASRFDMGGESLIRPPRGFDPAHPLIEDLKRKDFIATADLSEVDVLGTKLLPTIVKALQGLAPLVDYLCAGLDLEFDSEP